MIPMLMVMIVLLKELGNVSCSLVERTNNNGNRNSEIVFLLQKYKHYDVEYRFVKDLSPSKFRKAPKLKANLQGRGTTVT